MRTDGVSPLRGHQKTPRPVQRKLKKMDFGQGAQTDQEGNTGQLEANR